MYAVINLQRICPSGLGQGVVTVQKGRNIRQPKISLLITTVNGQCTVLSP